MAAKMFRGKETRAEEMAEAKALKSGKISKDQYMAGEKSEGNHSAKEIKRNADAIKSGRMSPAKYAGEHMADGGLVRGGYGAPNECTYNLGPGVRSRQDYKK
jgi:hypothetical protein